MKKIIYALLSTAIVLTAFSCNDILETSSPSVVDRDFVFSNENTARSALYYGYQKLSDLGDIHSYGFYWNPVWGSDIEDSQDVYSEGNAGILENGFTQLVHHLSILMPVRVLRYSQNYMK